VREKYEVRAIFFLVRTKPYLKMLLIMKKKSGTFVGRFEGYAFYLAGYQLGSICEKLD